MGGPGRPVGAWILLALCVSSHYVQQASGTGRSEKGRVALLTSGDDVSGDARVLTRRSPPSTPIAAQDQDTAPIAARLRPRPDSLEGRNTPFWVKDESPKAQLDNVKPATTDVNPSDHQPHALDRTRKASQLTSAGIAALTDLFKKEIRHLPKANDESRKRKDHQLSSKISRFYRQVLVSLAQGREANAANIRRMMMETHAERVRMRRVRTSDLPQLSKLLIPSVAGARQPFRRREAVSGSPIPH